MNNIWSFISGDQYWVGSWLNWIWYILVSEIWWQLVYWIEISPILIQNDLYFGDQFYWYILVTNIWLLIGSVSGSWFQFWIGISFYRLKLGNWRGIWSFLVEIEVGHLENGERILPFWKEFQRFRNSHWELWKDLERIFECSSTLWLKIDWKKKICLVKTRKSPRESKKKLEKSFQNFESVPNYEAI